MGKGYARVEVLFAAGVAALGVPEILLQAGAVTGELTLDELLVQVTRRVPELAVLTILVYVFLRAIMEMQQRWIAEETRREKLRSEEREEDRRLMREVSNHLSVNAAVMDRAVNRLETKSEG